MNAIVIEHVKVEELPVDWRARLAAEPEERGTAWVTVRIEAEAGCSDKAVARLIGDDDPLFGMWQDRQDMADVARYARVLREPRSTNDEATPGC